MRRTLRLLASVSVAAAALTLFTAPVASADEPTGSAPVTLKLRPVKVAKSSPGIAPQATQQATQQAYYLGPVSDWTRCLDADLNTINGNGTKVQLWSCIMFPDGTVPANQAWYITQIPEGYYRFQNAYSGRYLDADLNTINRNGTKIQLWDYVAGARNQWFDDIVIPEGFERFQNAYSGRYLDADLNTSGRDGTIVQLWDYVGGATNQWWG
ncbi:RICIN domain-containing protein [Amycolatopsis taiwanensis]|uniref:RICIN domain-containing protein n=1 Tax=Amycolatopsis taiwanensis TaxID=342230 RepID=UPI00047F9BAD|nr:RICIN domain-containing protein [Amycolatopsis taiwanensis]